MKIFTTFTFIFLLAASYQEVYGQKIVYSSYLVRTSQGVKTGLSLSNRSKDMFEYGAFYQQSSDILTQKERLKPFEYERSFYGIIVTAPIYEKWFTINITTKTGVVNNKHFAIRSSVFAEIPVLSRLYLRAGVGMNSFRPSYHASIFFRR